MTDELYHIINFWYNIIFLVNEIYLMSLTPHIITSELINSLKSWFWLDIIKGPNKDNQGSITQKSL